MVANQIECSKIEKMSVIKVLAKFSEECMKCIEKYILVKKMFTNGLNMCLPVGAWTEKSGNTLALP